MSSNNKKGALGRGLGALLQSPETDITTKTIRMIVDTLGYIPRFGVEVGSFVGASATLLGNFMNYLFI